MNKNFTLRVLLLISILLISCNKKKSANKSDFGIPSEEPNMNFSQDNFSSNSIHFVNYHRKELQEVLPNSIHDILLTYKDLLVEVEKNKIYSTSANEHHKYMLQAQTKAFDSLISKDLAVNSSYSVLLQDLENLNMTYSQRYCIPIDSFKSYYSLDKIILSEEVFLKIQDLLKEDEKRIVKIKRETRNEMAADGAILALNLIPWGGFLAQVPAFSKSAITQIHNGVSSASKNKVLAEGAGKIAKLTFTLTQKSGSSKISNDAKNKIVRMISNDAKRTVLSTNLTKSTQRLAAQNIVMSSKNGYDELSDQQNNQRSPRELFKVIENKLEGRIGDFSDGILAVHLQNIREAIKYNQSLVSKKNIDRF